MDWVRVVAYVGVAAIAALAVVLARRDRTHAAFAAWAVWACLIDYARMGVRVLREDAVRPYSGIARFAWHVDELFFLSWSFGLIAVVLHTFTRLNPAWVLIPFGISFGLCLDYPAMTGEALALFYRAVSLGECLVIWAAIAWAMLARTDLRPSITHLVIMFVATTEVIAAAVPYASGFFRDWDMVRMANIVTAVGCVIAQAWQLTRRPVQEEHPT